MLVYISYILNDLHFYVKGRLEVTLLRNFVKSLIVYRRRKKSLILIISSLVPSKLCTFCKLLSEITDFNKFPIIH